MNVFIVDDPHVKGRKRRIAIAMGADGRQAFVDGFDLDVLRLDEVVAAAPARDAGILAGMKVHSPSIQTAQRLAHPRSAHKAPHGTIVAPMAGRVLEVLVDVGARVEKGARLVVLEAMKTEQTLESPFNGTVRKVLCKAEQQVTDGAWLVELDGATEQET